MLVGIFLYIIPLYLIIFFYFCNAIHVIANIFTYLVKVY